VIGNGIQEVMNWNMDEVCSDGIHPLAWWYVVVSLPGLVACVLGACIVGWQLPNRSHCLTIVALLLDLFLGAMLAWGIALYSSPGWCDFWFFDALLVAWGVSIPLLFVFTYLWGRFRLRVVHASKGGGRRRLRRVIRQATHNIQNNNRNHRTITMPSQFDASLSAPMDEVAAANGLVVMEGGEDISLIRQNGNGGDEELALSPLSGQMNGRGILIGGVSTATRAADDSARSSSSSSGVFGMESPSGSARSSTRVVPDSAASTERRTKVGNWISSPHETQPAPDSERNNAVTNGGISSRSSGVLSSGRPSARVPRQLNGRFITDNLEVPISTFAATSCT